MGAELLHAERHTDGQADVTELKVDFWNFSNALKNTELRNTEKV
jgi:hypothetical protein